MVDANAPIRDVRRWRRGDKITDKRLNEGVDAINRIVGGVKPPRQVAAGGRPTVGSSGAKIEQLKVVTIGDDLLVCVPYDSLSADTENPFLVAMPYLLRRTPFDGLERDGITYTYIGSTSRDATDGSDTERQLITPSYVAGDIIYAARNITGKTDVRDINDVVIEWLDINVDGRAWAKAPST